MANKQDIRNTISAKRNQLDPRWLETASMRVVKNLQTLESFQKARTIGLYMAIGGEVDLGALFPVCRELRKRICIPVFDAESKLYQMAEIKEDTPFRRSRYGIQEPIDPNPVDVNLIDLMVVPGVAFDPYGNRLGRGGGYYDRLLEGFRGQAIGAAFDFQILPEIPTSEHDQATACVVTESKIFNF